MLHIKLVLSTPESFPFSAHYSENSRFMDCRFEAWLTLIVGQELLNSHLPQWSDLLQEISSRCPLFNRFEHLIQLMKLCVLLLFEEARWCWAKPGKWFRSNTWNPAIWFGIMIHSNETALKIGSLFSDAKGSKVLHLEMIQALTLIG